MVARERTCRKNFVIPRLDRGIQLDPAVKPRDDTAWNAFTQFFHFTKEYIKQNNLKCVVFGSPHTVEHEIALQCAEFCGQLLIIYVPHEVSEASCALLYQEFQNRGALPILYSEIITLSSRGLTAESSALYPVVKPQGDIFNVIIINEIGRLAEIYALGQIAVIGGGFDGQIHNVLEPSAHGVPVLIGSKFARAPEALALVQAEAALSFPEPNLLFQFISQWVILTKNMKPLIVAQKQATKLFSSLPNTNQIILNTFLQPRGRRFERQGDRNKT